MNMQQKNKMNKSLLFIRIIVLIIIFAECKLVFSQTADTNKYKISLTRSVKDSNLVKLNDNIHLVGMNTYSIILPKSQNPKDIYSILDITKFDVYRMQKLLNTRNKTLLYGTTGFITGLAVGVYVDLAKENSIRKVSDIGNSKVTLIFTSLFTIAGIYIGSHRISEIWQDIPYDSLKNFGQTNNNGLQLIKFSFPLKR